jgi:hypothetical protein
MVGFDLSMPGNDLWTPEPDEGGVEPGDDVVPTNDVPCVPSCGGKVCGPDSCGGVCGTCPAGQTCQEGACGVFECGSDPLSVTGTFKTSVSDIPFNTAKAWLTHKQDVDIEEDGCIMSVGIEVGYALGCKLSLEASGTMQGNKLKIQTASFTADSQCPGFPDSQEGTYYVQGVLETGWIVLNPLLVPDHNAVTSCFGATLQVEITGTLVADGVAQQLKILPTLLTVTGDVVSNGSTSGKCPCTPQCQGKQCGDDGCGGMCGKCPEGQTCNNGQCSCVPNCAGKQCGTNGCGGVCGTCQAGWTCTEWGQCHCTPNCVGKVCGDDGCGALCGNCPAGQSCVNGACKANCTPSCAGKQCGDNGCGGNCGNCPAGQSCVNFQCKANCTPACTGKQCGDNGCGGVCGTCPSGKKCVNFACVNDSGGCCTAATCGNAGNCPSPKNPAEMCYCDSACTQYGDCCADVCSVCGYGC